MNTRLQHAIALRQAGEVDQARALLLELHQEQPDDPQVNYHCAWVHDLLGEERAAVPYYRRALELGLSGEEARRGATVGLGSTLRALGRYEEAAEVLRGGVAELPGCRELQVFLAMALYNLGEHEEAMGLLLRNLVETTADEGIGRYGRALLFYAERLDETWEGPEG